MTPKATAIYDLIHRGDMDAAREALEEWRLEGGDEFTYWTLFAGWHMRQYLWGAAIEPLQRAIALQPLGYTSHYNLGYTFHKIGQFNAAAACYEQALKLNPNHPQSWVRLGHVCILTERFALALACYGYVSVLAPNDQEARCGYGTALSVFGDDAAAEKEYRRALELDPAMAEAEMGLGFTLLRAGKWEEGWDRRQASLRHPPFGSPWNYKVPAYWYGKPKELSGKRVLLRSEQGHGDTLQFARYVPLVAKRAAETWLLTEPSLARLVEGLGAKVITAKDELPDCEIDTTLMSLPGIFGTRPDYCPPPAAYKVTARDVGARVGLCWHGGARPFDPAAHADDKRRSLPWEAFAPFAETVPCVSLQEEDLRAWGCKDWRDTAEIVKGLDLVITVDTAVAHLAASLGVETWVLSRAGGCWRWLGSGDRTAWYPTMRIYRQVALCEWGPTLERLRADLQGWVARHAAQKVAV